MIELLSSKLRDDKLKPLNGVGNQKAPWRKEKLGILKPLASGSNEKISKKLTASEFPAATVIEKRPYRLDESGKK